jgi:hypothetical protein
MTAAYGILVGKAEVVRTLQEPTLRRDDNIKMDFREVFDEVVK